jgi:hypothetical protein
MTHSTQNRGLPRLFVSSTLGTTLVSIAAAWIVTSVAFATPDTPSTVHAYQPHGHNFQLSPIPPGADWTS